MLFRSGAGALKDMIQSHLLIIMAMVAMEEVASVDEVELRDLMEHVLRATRLMGTPKEASRRARYTEGRVGRRNIPNYVDEPGVDPDRRTETLAEITVEIRNSRWSGVPFRLRSGKALGVNRRGIYLHFEPVSHDVEGLANLATPNCIKLGMSPETIELSVTTNGAGDVFELETTTRREDRRQPRPSLRRDPRPHPRRQPAALGARRHRRGVLADRRAGPEGLVPGRGAAAVVCGGQRGAARLGQRGAAARRRTSDQNRHRETGLGPLHPHR